MMLRNLINNYGTSITTYETYYLDLTSTSSTTQRLETNSIINSYSLTSLTEDVQYKIFIAKNSNGESSKSNTNVGYSSSVPTNLQAATLVSNSRTSNSFKVTWDITSITSSFPILGYEVLVKD